MADLLVEVMDRRTKEEKEGKDVRPTHTPAPPDPKRDNKGLSS